MEKSITEIVWTNPAKGDLKDIFDYIAEFSEGAALRIITKILDRVGIIYLALYPANTPILQYSKTPSLQS